MRIFALVTDAFGGFGGIAQYSRDFLSALVRAPTVREVVVLPRQVPSLPDGLPAGICQSGPAASRIVYSGKALRNLVQDGPFDVIFCGHILMTPLAALLARSHGARLWVQVHGIDAWASPGMLVQKAMQQAALITSVSRFTRSQMLGNWLDTEPWRVRVLPNTVGEAFTPGPVPAGLRQRYRIGNRRVILTISRISAADSYKGHDRVIAALPEVIRRGADVTYLVAGDGDGLPRLKQLVAEAGLADRVQFIGRIADAELVDHYRLADVFIMPSTGEGFGIVFVEAAACGAPVIGGNKDGSWDALREGRLGQAIDHDKQDELAGAILAALNQGRANDATAAAVFSRDRFVAHVGDLVREIAELPKAS